MKLSTKLFTIIALINLILLSFIYLVSKTFLLKDFTNIEIDTAHSDTNIVLNYIQRDLSNLNSLNVDYAKWDDTYNYLNNRNAEYISSNFDDTTALIRAKVAFILIADNLGNTVYKKNIEYGEKDKFTEGLAKNISLSVLKLLSNNNTKNIMGIAIFDKTPILISAERISKSDGSGNSAGIFVFAKYYDQNEITDINKNTNLETGLLTYDKNLILKADSAKKDTFVKITNNNFITGYGLLNNIFSEPSLFVKVTLQRKIFRKAENAIYFYFLIILLALILVSISIFMIIHVFVVKKIEIINKIIENVNNSHDLSTSITLKGKDEISELGSKFNSMFNRLKKSNEAYIALVNYDMITGLLNRNKLIETSSELLKNEKENLAFFFIDLDKFKAINDRLGHAAGDIVLAKVAERLKNNTRPKDIVSRVGGDEFIVVIRDLKSSSSATEIAEKLVKVLSDAFIYNDNAIYIGASVGISLFPKHGTDVETLIKNADLAMYEVKNSGGYGCTIYNFIMNDNNIRKVQMENKLKNAMSKNEFITYYQPIIDLKSMKVLSAESLIRWKLDEKIIQPLEFIPIAKKLDEIVKIDNWMLYNACAQCKKWQELGVKDFSISVNTSYKQLLQFDFVELVVGILHNQLLDPKYLNIEITEDEAMEDIDLITKVLRELKLQGIKISIDDFGTGYSSLSCLSILPIDIIKIDRSLIVNLDNNPKNIVIIKSIVAVAKSLNMKVLAEGIETETEFVALKELQCDYIQGYLIGKPMPASDFQDSFIK